MNWSVISIQDFEYKKIPLLFFAGIVDIETDFFPDT